MIGPNHPVFWGIHLFFSPSKVRNSCMTNRCREPLQEPEEAHGIWEGRAVDTPPICPGWVLVALVHTFLQRIQSKVSFPVPPLKQWSRSRKRSTGDDSRFRGTSRKVHIQNHRNIDPKSIDIWKILESYLNFASRISQDGCWIFKDLILKKCGCVWKLVTPKVDSSSFSGFKWPCSRGSSSACFRQPHSLKPSPSRFSLEVVGHFLGPIREPPCAVVFRRRS